MPLKIFLSPQTRRLPIFIQFIFADEKLITIYFRGRSTLFIIMFVAHLADLIW